MQVKKFEAKTMKEALHMVKHHLGPEAVILSARENNSHFGLGGHTSVEVTAAVSQDTLLRKKLAESKLNEKTREKYSNSSAKSQKDFIDKVFHQHKTDQLRPGITQRQYIDIIEEERPAVEPAPVPAAAPVQAGLQPDEPVGHSSPGRTGSNEALTRIRRAALDAMKAVQQVSEKPQPKKPAEAPAVSPNDKTVHDLRREINYLKKMIAGFQKVPQSFTGSMHPGADYGLPFELSFMFEKLTRAGVDVESASEILNLAKKRLSREHLKKKAYVSAWVAQYFLDNVKVVSDWMAGRYHVFVGATGQGKTSSLVKLASHLVIRQKKKVAIVGCDAQKVGASDQLRIYAQILNVPFIEIRRPEDWAVVEQRLGSVDHILVDMPGRNLKNPNEVAEIQRLLPGGAELKKIHFVQSILAKDSDVFELANRYRHFGINDVIFTRLDEASQHGLLFSFQQRFGVPLHSFGIGDQVPEDFEPATKERVVDLIFKLTKIRKESEQ